MFFKSKIFLASLLFVALITPEVVFYFGYYVPYQQGFAGYLSQASNANTVDIAKKSLVKAIHYLEKNKLTKGNTSIIYSTPDNDLEFFYKNLKASLSELQKADSKSQLEQTNVLIKLRETLTDNSKNGTVVTQPDSLYLYPYQFLSVLFALFGLLAVLLVLIIIKLIEEEF
jgi:hypothetical protein